MIPHVIVLVCCPKLGCWMSMTMGGNEHCLIDACGSSNVPTSFHCIEAAEFVKKSIQSLNPNAVVLVAR